MPDNLQLPLRVLLVDNHAEDAKRITEALAKANPPSTVQHITDPNEALPLLQDDPDSIDLIVTEHVLPGMTGLELYILFRENEIRKPIVLLTGSGSEHLAAMAMRAGINDYIIKDPNYEYLDLLNFTLPLVVTRYQDAVEKQKQEAEQEYRLEFERLISTLSTNFINLPFERIDEGITEALGSVARLTDADRSWVYSYKKNKKKTGFELTHSWCSEAFSSSPPPDFVEAVKENDELFVQRLQKHEIISITAADSNEKELRILEPILMSGNTNFALIMPMTRGSQVFGFIGFDNPHHEEGWTQGAIAAIRIMSEMFLNALSRKQIEVKLRDSEEQYRHLVENQADGIAMIELKTLKLKFCNAPTDDLFGRPVGGLNGRQLNEFVVPHKMHELEVLQSDLKTNEKLLIEIEIFAERGTRRRLQMSARPIASNGDKVPTEAFCIFRDVTQRQELEEQLRQAQKLEAVGEIAGGMAHELHHLFERINDQLLLIKDQLEADSAVMENFDNISRITEEGAVLLRQVMSFSAKNVQAAQVVNLKRTVEKLSSMMQRLLGKNIEIELDLADELWRIFADVGHIEQIIVNISLNARDAMPQGGKLVYKLENISIDTNNSADVSGVPYGEYVLLTISDNGVGMTEEVRERLFDPYFTTKSREASSGLGLSIVYNNVRSCEGEIRIASEIGQGSSFKIYFPRYIVKDDSIVTESEPDAPEGIESVLLVEDDPNFRQLAEVMLEHVGYTVVVANDGEDALEIFEHFGMQFDLLVADVVLPGIDGVKLAETLLLANPDIKVLLISGFPEVAVAKDAGSGDGFSFLGKPFSAAEFAERVRKVLDNG